MQHTKLRFSLAMLIAAFAVMAFTGCTEIKNIPPGYVGKILTPTGWQAGYLEPGQVDIGDLSAQGQGNTLVLCEAANITLKEQFLGKDSKENTDGEDHRLLTKDLVPVATDIYVQLGLKLADDGSGRFDEKYLDMIFSTVTPATTDDGRVRLITLQMVYDQWAKLNVRSRARSIFSKYADDRDVMSHYQQVSDEVSNMVIEVFRESKVPMYLAQASLGNVKIDEKVWAARSGQAAANAVVQQIDEIGAAMRRNPEYGIYMKWKAVEEAGKNPASTIVITGDDPMGKLVGSVKAAQPSPGSGK